jgi:hypothetical protein
MESESNSRLPERFNEGVALAEWMRQRCVFEEFAERCRIVRQGGYSAEDALLFFNYYFTSYHGESIKDFGDLSRPYRESLGAIGGRKKLASPSAMSRLLSSATDDAVGSLMPWLLVEVPGAYELLGHPSVLTRDVTGGAWHLFDWDETVDTLRQRGLPKGENMPPGRRRSAALAKAGHKGRKRGDVQMSRGTLQHSGSGLWIAIWMGPGNGDRGAVWFEQALRVLFEVCTLAGIPRERTVLRSDGIGGNVPFITECKSTDIGYITRLARYELLFQPEVADHLNQALWYRVPSSGSGPERQATDLGTVMLTPSKTTLRPDGSTYNPIETRVVCSRYPDINDRGAGKHIAGWRYELFACGMPADLWPAPMVVTGYYGRCGQENRFAQEDKELELGRVFSYEPPGQALATAIGLLVWNLRTCRGFELAELTSEQPIQPRTELEVMSPVTHNLCALSSSLLEASDSPAFDVPTGSEPRESETVDEAQVLEATFGEVADVPSTTEPRPSETVDEAQALEAVHKEVAMAVATSGYEPPTGWKWDPERASIICPNEAILTPRGISTLSDSTWTALRFEAPKHACNSCSQRKACTRSTNPNLRRRIYVKLPADYDAESLSQNLRLSETARRRTRQSPRRSNLSTLKPQAEIPSLPLQKKSPGKPWRPPKQVKYHGLLALTFAALLPAKLRRAFRGACRMIEVHVTVLAPSCRLQSVPFYAYNDGQRQHRRLTWEQRSRWNELPHGTAVTISFYNAGELKSCLTRGPPLSGERDQKLQLFQGV